VKRFGFEKIHLSRISERYWRQGGIRGNYGIYLRFSPLGANVFSRVFHEFSILTISSAPRSWAVIWRIENRKPAGFRKRGDGPRFYSERNAQFEPLNACRRDAFWQSPHLAHMRLTWVRLRRLARGGSRCGMRWFLSKKVGGLITATCGLGGPHYGEKQTAKHARWYVSRSMGRGWLE
jgi:hypothetical protein